jgi:hypothetical protein
VKKRGKRVQVCGPPTPDQVRKWTALELWEAAFRPRAGDSCFRKFPDPVAVCIQCAHVFHHLPVEHECMRLPTKEDRGKGPSPLSADLKPGQLLSPFSSCWEFLTTNVLPNGKARRLPRLSLTCDGKALRLTLNDEESSQYASWQATSPDDLFLMMEEALATDSVPWRPSSYGGSRR